MIRTLEFLDEALRRFPHSIVYRIESNRLGIIAVAHARRRPGYWKDRLGTSPGKKLTRRGKPTEADVITSPRG